MKNPLLFRRLGALVATAGLVLAGAATAAADNVVSDGDGVVPVANSDLSLGTIACNEARVSTPLIAVTRNGNAGSPQVFQNGSTVTISVIEVTGPGVSAVMNSPSTITLPGNWSTFANTTLSSAVSSTVTVLPTANGAGTGSVTYEARGVNASGGTVDRTDTMNISWNTTDCVSNTAPTVLLTGVTEGASYEIGSVPSATCEVSDLEDGPVAPFAATLSMITGEYSAFGIGSQTATCDYTDSGGLSAVQASATYSIVDTIAPAIIDQGPTSGPDGAAGWYITPVVNQFFASDAGSGLPPSLVNPWTVSSKASEGSAVTIASGPVADNVGNTAPSIDSAAFKIDLSDPTNVAFVGGPEADGTYPFGYVPPAPTCTAADAVSGLGSCVVTGHSTSLGTHTMTATATDNAGRTATATRTYTVEAWTLDGFKRPVDMGSVTNVVKGGSTVPLKFEVFAGATELTTTEAIGTFRAVKTTCTAQDPIDWVETTVTGKTSLRYDTVEGQFIQNWQTPKEPGACYLVAIKTADGSSIVAKFQLK